MKKRQALKFLYQLKQLRKSAATKRKRGERLLDEADTEEQIIRALEGATIHNGQPIRVIETLRGECEVEGACDEIKRRAYVSTSFRMQYKVTVFNHENDEGKTPECRGTRKWAVTAAKDWVASGKEINEKH